MKDEKETKLPRHPIDSLTQIYEYHENWVDLEEHYDEEAALVVNEEMFQEAKEYVYNLLLRAGDNWRHILSCDVLELDPYNDYFSFLYEYVPEQHKIRVEYISLWFYYIWKQIYRCFGWEECKKLPPKVFNLLRELNAYGYIPIKDEENKNGEISLEEKLNTDTAKVAFKRAIDKGWIKKTGTHLMWLGSDDKKNKAQLAYFCGRIYGYRYDENKFANVGKKIPYKALENLFNVSRLDVALKQVYDSKKKQKWRKEIDDIMS